jgi:glycosyltransferase involved in cell wall biosynthesis
MAGADLVVIPSKSGEGLPRVCLEAISIGCKVVLPPGVPEFRRQCPDFVLPRVTAEAIAGKMEEVLLSDKTPQFTWEDHEPAKALRRYVSLYQELVN